MTSEVDLQCSRNRISIVARSTRTVLIAKDQSMRNKKEILVFGAGGKMKLPTSATLRSRTHIVAQQLSDRF